MPLQAQDLFSALANDIRLRCLMLMQLEGKLCVCEFTHALDLSQPMISRHLALLRKNDLVIDCRAGQWIYYQINPQLDEWAQQVLSITAQQNRKQKPFIDDLRALKRMCNRPANACCV